MRNALNFPNSAVATIRIATASVSWGHDQMMEVPFFLDEDVLFKLYPRTKNAESAMLESFDLARDRIFEVAGKAYRPGQRRAFYVLTANDFCRARSRVARSG